jgi:hypothetical protein
LHGPVQLTGAAQAGAEVGQGLSQLLLVGALAMLLDQCLAQAGGFEAVSGLVQEAANALRLGKVTPRIVQHRLIGLGHAQGRIPLDLAPVGTDVVGTGMPGGGKEWQIRKGAVQLRPVAGPGQLPGVFFNLARSEIATGPVVGKALMGLGQRLIGRQVTLEQGAAQARRWLHLLIAVQPAALVEGTIDRFPGSRRDRLTRPA